MKITRCPFDTESTGERNIIQANFPAKNLLSWAANDNGPNCCQWPRARYLIALQSEERNSARLLNHVLHKL